MTLKKLIITKIKNKKFRRMSIQIQIFIKVFILQPKMILYLFYQLI